VDRLAQHVPGGERLIQVDADDAPHDRVEADVGVVQEAQLAAGRQQLGFRVASPQEFLRARGAGDEQPQDRMQIRSEALLVKRADRHEIDVAAWPLESRRQPLAVAGAVLPGLLPLFFDNAALIRWQRVQLRARVGPRLCRPLPASLTPFACAFLMRGVHGVKGLSRPWADVGGTGGALDAGRRHERMTRGFGLSAKAASRSVCARDNLPNGSLVPRASRGRRGAL
jgi:hypothetical protein